MKYLAILVAGLLCSCAQHYTKLPTTQPTRAAIVKAQESTERVSKHVSSAQAQVSQAQKRAKTAQDKLKKLEAVVSKQQEALTLTQGIQTEVDALAQELGTTQEALKAAQDEVKVAQAAQSEAIAKSDAMQKELNAKQAILDRAVATEKKYHTLKWGVCFLAAGLVGAIMVSLWKYLLPLGWFGLGIGLAPPIATFAYLMFKL